MRERIHTITGLHWRRQPHTDGLHCSIEGLELMFANGGLSVNMYYLYVDDVFIGRGAIADLWSEWLNQIDFPAHPWQS